MSNQTPGWAVPFKEGLQEGVCQAWTGPQLEGVKECKWKPKELSGKKAQKQREDHESVGEFPEGGRAGEGPGRPHLNGSKQA